MVVVAKIGVLGGKEFVGTEVEVLREEFVGSVVVVAKIGVLGEEEVVC